VKLFSLNPLRGSLNVPSAASSAKEQVAFQGVHSSHFSHHFSFHFSDHSNNSSAKHAKMKKKMKLKMS